MVPAGKGRLAMRELLAERFKVGDKVGDVLNGARIGIVKAVTAARGYLVYWWDDGYGNEAGFGDGWDDFQLVPA